MGDVEHPGWYDDPSIIDERADEHILGAPSLAVVNLNLRATCGVPAVVNLCIKLDMGRMTWGLL